uniref:Reverse transcriptase n=1 Tax=Neogobius melanostomus TaxID=47308 RepID=A0A8C6S797_9GOBI
MGNNKSLSSRLDDFILCCLEKGKLFMNKKTRLPKLDLQDNQSLGAKITVDDVKKSINSLKNGKACGPDGFPAEVYKTFVDIFAPLLTRMFQYAYDNKKLPKTMQQSIISLIPKDHKDPENPASYRPLSIQNTDSKILANDLASQILNFIIGLHN